MTDKKQPGFFDKLFSKESDKKLSDNLESKDKVRPILKSTFKNSSMAIGEPSWYSSVTSFQQNFNANKPFLGDENPKYQLDPSNDTSSKM